MSKDLEQKTAQRAEAKRATFELLRAKPVKRQTFTCKIGDETATFVFEAIGGVRWDRIVQKHPPTTEQRAQGAAYNPQTLGPALLAACCKDPAGDEHDWAEIWNGEQFSKGELEELFWTAFNLCQGGLDINPIDAG